MSYRTDSQFTASITQLSTRVGQHPAASSRFRVSLSERWVLLLAVDLLLLSLLIGCGYLASALDLGLGIGLISWETGWYWSLLLIGGWWLLGELNDLYDIRSAHHRRATVVRISLIGVQALLLYGLLVYQFAEQLPPPYFFGVVALALPLILLWRLFYATLTLHFAAPQRVLMIGSGEPAQALAYLLHGSYPLSYQVVGYIDDPHLITPRPEMGLPASEKPLTLMAVVEQLQVNEIAVAFQGTLTEELVAALLTCQSQGVQVTWLPDFYERLARRVPVQHVDPAWALYAVQGQRIFQRLQLAIKRVCDLLLVWLALPCLLLLFPLLALAIRLDSPGPIFYRQMRSGRGGKPFAIYKFRTMSVDAEKDGRPRWATENDPRITRVGRFLRKTRLDELPQIFNVLKGEMSMVGPRPERPEFVVELQKSIPFYHVRLTVKPGITGWAQVHYDYGNSTEDALHKLQYDFYYVRYWSLWLDLYIVFKTISVVLKLKGI